MPRTEALCTNCGGPIQWVRLPGNNWAPADIEPSLAGHFLLVELDDDRALWLSDADRQANLTGESDVPLERLLVDHRRTCGRWGATPTAALTRNAGDPTRERTRAAKIRKDTTH